MKKIILILILVLLSAQSVGAVARVDYEEQRQAEAQQQQSQMPSMRNGIVGLVPCTAWRDDTDPSKTPSGLNCNKWEEIVEVVNFFIQKAFVIATVLATLSFLYAGWVYLTSRGESGKLEKAHKIFWNVIKGFIFMAVAYLVVSTILKTIAVTDYSLLQY